MKTAAMVLFLSVLCAAPALAKRAAPAAVKPVVHGGLEFRAPSEKMGVVEAWDGAAGRMLWEKQVYAVKLDPNLEADVQHVFITKLEVADGALLVTNERGEVYSMDLKTRNVSKAAKPGGAAEKNASPDRVTR